MRRLFWSLGLLTYMALTGIQPAFAIPSISTNITSSASRLPLDGEGRSICIETMEGTIAIDFSRFADYYGG